MTKKLEATLRSLGSFESDSEQMQRLDVIERLNNITKEWIRDTSIAKNMDKIQAQKVGGKNFISGSYLLDVHGKDSDIDAICVVPRHISRQDFETSLFNKLKITEEVTSLRAIPAVVPLLKFYFSGINIDLMFTRLALKEVPDNLDLSDPMILKNLNEKCVLSINGYRNTEEILKCVPNLSNFKLALRGIRIWAKKRGIYSNMMGYLGGIGWAIMMARVCQLYPNAVPARLIYNFFLAFEKWDLSNPLRIRKVENVNLNYKTWNPKVNIGDRYQPMCVITPKYPHMNSSYNVSKSTYQVIKEEIKIGLAICNDIRANKAGWAKLFEPKNFFSKFEELVVVQATSSTEEDQVIWMGLVQSRLRYLVRYLEDEEGIKFAQVWPKTYSSVNEGEKKTSCHWFIGLHFNLNINNENKVNLITNLKWIFRSDVQYNANMCMEVKTGMEIYVNFMKKEDLCIHLPSEEHWKLKTVENSNKESNDNFALEGSCQDFRKRKEPQTEENTALLQKRTKLQGSHNLNDYAG